MPAASGKVVMHKIAMLGEGGVGKTSLTIALTMQHFVESYDPTLEDSYRRQCVIDGTAAMLEILDTAGQEEYTALREQWIRDSELFVIVYDVTRRSSFESTETLFRQILETKTKRDPSFNASLVALVGNKCDLETRRAVSVGEGRMLAQKLGCSFDETSAKTRVNVEEAFFKLVRADRRKRQDVEDKEVKRHKDDMVGMGVKPQSRASKMNFFRKILNRSD